MDTSVGNILLSSCCYSHRMLVLKALEAFQLVGAIFGLLQVTLMSSLVRRQIHPRATW